MTDQPVTTAERNARIIREIARLYDMNQIIDSSGGKLSDLLGRPRSPVRCWGSWR